MRALFPQALRHTLQPKSKLPLRLLSDMMWQSNVLPELSTKSGIHMTWQVRFKQVLSSQQLQLDKAQAAPPRASSIFQSRARRRQQRWRLPQRQARALLPPEQVVPSRDQDIWMPSQAGAKMVAWSLPGHGTHPGHVPHTQPRLQVRKNSFKLYKFYEPCWPRNFQARDSLFPPRKVAAASPAQHSAVGLEWLRPFSREVHSLMMASWSDTSQSSDGYLAYGGSTTFYATAVPSGSTQATVYTTSKSVSVSFQWQSK